MTFKVGDKVRAADSWDGEIVFIASADGDSNYQRFGVSVDTSTPEEKQPFFLTMYFAEDQLEAISA